jgi:AcrR family transcriptional regulator
MRSRKTELLDALIAYLQRHGLADLSLRPMAAATGTSARLLIFHFGSKERLLAEVLEEMQARLQRSFVQMGGQSGGAQRATLRVFWDWALKAENFAYLKLLYQLHILAAQSPKTYGRYLKKNSLNWLELIQAAMPPERRDPVLVTLIVAVFDGLFVELMSTGDRRRTTHAIDKFIEMAGSPAEPVKPSRRK